VAGVREERERSGDEATDDLGNHERAREQGRQTDAALIDGVSVPCVVIVVIVHRRAYRGARILQ
jgi:hypothetical protein